MQNLDWLVHLALPKGLRKILYQVAHSFGSGSLVVIGRIEACLVEMGLGAVRAVLLTCS